MTNEDIIENPNSYIPFEVVAVHNNTSQQNTGSSVPQPVNIKIKIRNKNEVVKGKRGLISVPKLNANTWPKKVRLVNSDQTIMSFNLVMEPSKDKDGNKTHRRFLQLFRPGGCLSIHKDEDEYSYMPTTSNELNSQSTPIMEGYERDATNETFSLKKNVFSPSYTNTFKKTKPFLGKCKPGGCLDPPFGEDKYIYKPKLKDSKILEQTIGKSNVNTTLLDANKNQAEVKLEIQTQESEISVLHQSYTQSTKDLEDSESLVTYPSSVSSSYVKNRDSQNRKSKSGMHSEQLESSRKLINELPVSFFMPPRKVIEQQIKGFDDYKEKHKKVKEAYINKEYVVQSQTPSEMLSDAIKITSPSFEEHLQNVNQAKETAEELSLISDINVINKDDKIFSQEQISTRDTFGIENRNTISKILESNHSFVSNIETLNSSVEINSIQKLEVENIVVEEKVTESEIKNQISLSDFKLSREKLKKASVNELKNKKKYEITKTEAGLRSGVNNILSPNQREVFEKETLKYETLKYSGTPVINDVLTKIDEPHLKLSQEDLTKTSIDKLNSLLNYPENEFTEIDIKRGTGLQNGMYKNIDKKQKEVFEKETLKHEASEASEGFSTPVRNDVAMKIDISDLKFTQEDFTKSSINKLNIPLNHSENDNIDEITKNEIGLRNEVNNILNPNQKNVFEKETLKYETSGGSHTPVGNDVPVKIQRSNLKLSQEELRKSTIDELNSLLNHSEIDNIDEIIKKQIGLPNGVNNVLNPTEKELFQKETLKYEASKGFSSPIKKYASVIIDTSNSKLSQKDFTESEINEINSPLNHTGRNSIDEIIKKEFVLQNGVNNVLNPNQKDVFEKSTLKYEASEGTRTISNDISVKNDKSNLNLSQEDLTKTSLDKLNSLLNSPENEFAEIDVKRETSLQNGMNNNIDEIEKDTLKYENLQDSRAADSNDDPINVGNEVDTDNFKNRIILQNRKSDSKHNLDENLKTFTENINEPRALSKEEKLLQNEENEEEKVDKQIKRSYDQISTIDTEISIKSDSATSENLDLNSKNLSIKSSKSIASEKALKIYINDDKKTSLQHTSSLYKDLPTSSKTSFESHKENHDIDTDKSSTRSNIPLQQEMLQRNFDTSHSPEIEKSENLEKEVFQDKDALKELSDSSILRSRQSSRNDNKKTELRDLDSLLHSKSLYNTPEPDQKSIDWLLNKVGERTTDEKKSDQSVKASENRVGPIFEENLNKNENRQLLSKIRTNKDFMEDINKLAKVPTKRDKTGLEPGNSDNIIPDLNISYAKIKADSSSTETEKGITSTSSVSINFAFRTLTKKFGYTIETLDPSTHLATYSQDKVTTVRTNLRGNNSNIKIPLDSETDMTIQIKKHTKQFEGSKSVTSNGGRNIIREYCSETSINKDQLLKETLSTVYETLVPIEKIIANLKEEADALFREQLLFKRILSSRERGPSRIIRTNKTCSCLEKEIGINYK